MACSSSTLLNTCSNSATMAAARSAAACTSAGSATLTPPVPAAAEAGGWLLAASAALLLGVLGPPPVRCAVVASGCASAAGPVARGDSCSAATAPCQSPLAIWAAVTAPSLASSCPSTAQRTTDTLSTLHTSEWPPLLGKRSCSARSAWGSCQDQWSCCPSGAASRWPARGGAEAPSEWVDRFQC